MYIMFRKQKYILYAADGYVLMISKDLNIIKHYARRADGKSNVERHRRAKNTTEANDVSNHDNVLPSN